MVPPVGLGAKKGRAKAGKEKAGVAGLLQQIADASPNTRAALREALGSN